MKPAALIVVALIALMTFAPARESAGVTLASQTVVEKTKEAAGKTKDAVVKGAKVVADKTEDGLSKTGEVMTDGWITTRVHARFVDEALLKDSDISVETKDHVVTLKGTVIGTGRPHQGDDCGEGNRRRPSCRESVDHRAEAPGLTGSLRACCVIQEPDID